MKRVARALLVSLVLLAPIALTPSIARAKTRGARPAPAPAPVVAERSAKADKPAPARAESKGDDKADDGAGAVTATKTADGKTLKTKTYTFGAMDVEGKLKTPQLLYFLNRVKLELDMSAPDKRSFMKELAKSADDKNL
jgi:hypothetical protein